MSSTFRTLGQSELLPRYIFAESLFARRRVLEIGAVASTLGQSARFLSTRGARIVVAADADLSAVQDAQARLSGPNLRFRAPVFDDLDAGSFDLVILADLASYVRAPELLKEVVRLVAKNGYLMGGLRNPAGLSLANVMEAEGVEAPPTYGQLLDALSTHFRSIEVATQSPVLGYQLAFEKGEGLQVDGSLAGAAEAAYYVVLAGHDPVRFFDPTWVQLPPEPLAFTGGKLEDASARARNWQERSDRLKEALGKSRDDVSRREGELKEIRAELEGSKEAISRLTAQIESVTQRPRESRQADELTHKVRRVEAELVVAKERAIDSEGRVASMREEVALQQREQKNATVETLAAQENARLERSRREQIATELEDARTRLTQAYEDLRRVQDDAAAQRVEAERAKLVADRVGEALQAKNRELDAARDKELRLAESRSESLAAVEGLQGEVKRAQAAVVAAEERARAREAEAMAAIRSLDLETQKHATLDKDFENARGRLKEVSDELNEKTASLSAAETELEGMKASSTRLQRDIETLSASERTWREMAQSYEQRLNDTLANVEALSEQVAKADAEKEHATARFSRMERDSSTAIGAERSAREQSQAALADTQAKLTELEEDREKLLEQRDDLKAGLEDLQKARRADQAALDTLRTEKTQLESRIDVLEHEMLDQGDRLHERSAAAERLSEELSAALERVERTEGDIADRLKSAEERAKELTKERDTARGEAARMSGQLDQGRQRVSDLAQRSARLETEANGLRARITEVEAQAKDRQERLQETQVKLTHAAKTAATVEREQAEKIETVQRELDVARADAEAQKARLEARLKEAEAALGETKGRTIDRERELEALRDSLQATEAARARLEGTLEADRHVVASARAELEVQLATEKEQVQRLTSRGEVLANESKVLQHELEVQLQRYQELEEQARKRAAEAEAELAEAKDRAQRELHDAKVAGDELLQAAEGASQQRLAVLQQEIEHFKSDRLELEGRLTSTQQHAEHLDAELAEAAELRSTEAQLREKAEAERDALKAELDAAKVDAAKANEWVVGGKSENERLAAQMKTAAEEIERANAEAIQAKQALERETAELTAAKARTEVLEKGLADKEQERVAVSDQLSREKAEGALAKQQVEATKADVVRAEDEQKKVRSELDELQKRLDAQVEAQRQEATGKAAAQAQETQALADQLQSVKKELQLSRAAADRAQSEARGHQAGKLQLQKDHDALRGELTRMKASVAVAGGEAQAISDARAQAEGELKALQERAQAAEGLLAKAESSRDALQAELAQALERQKGVTAEVSAMKGAAVGNAGELEAALVARRAAEEMVIKMRSRYGELELQMKTELPAMREQISELGADNQLLETERERLAAQVERLEATRSHGADQEKELKNRVDMLQRRVNAQDAELNALRRRAGAVAPASPAAGPQKTVPGVKPRGVPLGESENPTLKQPRPSQPQGPAPAQRSAINTAITPVMSPVVKEPLTRASAPKPPVKAADAKEDVELEVFELELGENGDDEELLLLEDEASDPGPGSGNGGKK